MHAPREHPLVMAAVLGTPARCTRPIAHAATWPKRPPPRVDYLSQIDPDSLRAVCQHLCLDPKGGPQLLRLCLTCRSLRDALQRTVHPEVVSAITHACQQIILLF